MARRSVVMGGAGGIGAATCRALGRAGHQVVVVDFDGERATQVALDLRRDEIDAHAEQCDTTSGEAVEALRERIEREHGLVDGLVNMAGLARNDLLVKVKDADFNLTITTHLNSTLNGLRAFLPGMRRRGYGRVVNMSSTAARGSFGGAAYASAKAAIEGLTRSAAMEMASSGVTVNCVAPGLINTGIFLTTPKDYQAKGIAATPMGRAGEPAEVAGCIRFLLSDDASFVTGQTLYICGGMSIGPI